MRYQKFQFNFQYSETCLRIFNPFNYISQFLYYFNFWEYFSIDSIFVIYQISKVSIMYLPIQIWKEAAFQFEKIWKTEASKMVSQIFSQFWSFFQFFSRLPFKNFQSEYFNIIFINFQIIFAQKCTIFPELFALLHYIIN